MSQYLPDGLLYSALKQSSKCTDVYVPRQPSTDHRSKAFPYNIHSAIQGKRIDSTQIISDRRKVSSHIKTLFVKYDDKTARIICGTDNFATHLQKFVRNEEIAVILDLDLKQDEDLVRFNEFVSLMNDIGEITDEIRNNIIG